MTTRTKNPKQTATQPFTFPTGKFSAAPKMDEHFLIGAASNLSSWDQFIKEFIDNFLDHDTGRVHLRAGRGRDAAIVFDVEQPNMTDEQQHIYAFTLGDSTSARDITKRGCRGQGERMASLDRAGSLTLIALIGDGHAARYRIDRERWWKRMSGYGDYEVEREIIPVPDDFPFETGRRVILEDLRTAPNPKEGKKSEPIEVPPDVVFTEIIQKFPRWVVSTITLNGKRLKKKDVPGERARYSEEHDTYGVIDVELVVPETRDISDEIEFGISARAMSFKEFLHELRSANPDLYREIPESLRDPRLIGHIFIGALKLFKTQSYSFKEGLYTSDFTRVFVRDLLHNTIGPLAHKLLARVDEQVQKTAAVTVLRDVISEINAAEGGLTVRPGSGGGALLAASDPVIYPRVKKLECGDSVAFEIMNIDEGDTVLWDDSNAGGTIDDADAHEVLFTAGRRKGEFTIAATVQHGGKEYKCTANIHVVGAEKNAERTFRIQPSFVSLNRGETRRVRLINIGRTSRAFRIETSDDLVVTATLDDTETELVLTAHQKIAESTVRVIDKHDSTIVAACTVEVVPEPIERNPTDGTDPGGLGGDGNHDSPLSETLRIEGNVFRWIPHATTGMRPAEIKGSEIWVNLSRNPIFTTALAPHGLRQVLRHQIALAYAVWKLDEQGRDDTLIMASGGEVHDIVTKLLIRWLQGGVEVKPSS